MSVSTSQAMPTGESAEDGRSALLDRLVVQGDAKSVLEKLPAAYAQCCVTSPPYFGLRDYGEDGQIGLEETSQEYVDRIVEVFREVKRVLRDDGLLWLVIGDSYAARAGKRTKSDGGPALIGTPQYVRDGVHRPRTTGGGVKAKDLIGIPWMVAFALRADGWYLRSDIIWHKPNPMPSSVRDRCTTAHEYVFMLSKKPRYYFDQVAILEKATGKTAHDVSGTGYKAPGQTEQSGNRAQRTRAEELVREGGLTDDHLRAIRAVGITDTGKATVTQNGTGRNSDEMKVLAAEAKKVLGGYYREFLLSDKKNKRDVWAVSTQPFPDAHFAVFPPKLILPMILAGSADTACGVCGAPWRRVVERTKMEWREGPTRDDALDAYPDDSANGRTALRGTMTKAPTTTTTGWEPSCDHHDDSGRSIVLDPFCGAGTTGVVAVQQGRRFLGIDLSEKYCRMARERIEESYREGQRGS